MKHGLLLVAHGARDPLWARPFDEVARRIRQRALTVAVELCFLELMPPGLIEGGARLVAAGCMHIDIVPLFLGAGGHVRKDLPAALNALRTAHASVQWALQPAIGEIDSVVEAMAEAALHFMPDAQDAPPAP